MNAEHKEILKHSGNYFLAMMATKALSFISLPVLTYLLSVEDYGIYNVFSSTTGVLCIILTLNSEVAISRYYYESQNIEDFKRFVGTSLILTFSIFVLLSSLLFLTSKQLASFIHLERLLTICIIPYSLYSILNSIFQQIYQPLLKSKKIAILSCVQSYSTFAFSVVFIMLLNEKKYYGLVLGATVAMIFVGSYIFRQILKYSIFCFDKKHVKYILNYAIPYLPYSLSGIIIIQLGNLIIGNQGNFIDAGQYSFASNIALLMMVIISLCHSAWNPFYFKYMNEKRYEQLDDDYKIMWRATLLVGACLSLFASEIGFFFARNPQYTETLYFVPILVMGYLFYQWSYVYIRNVMYAKKTIWNAVVVISSGVLNVILNALLFVYYNTLGIAISFSISYVFMFILSFFINKYIIKVYATRLSIFIKPLIIYLPIFFFSIYIRSFVDFSWNMFILKILIVLFFTLLMFYHKIKKYLCF